MENNNASIRLINGLGDKLLDAIGFFILCKYLNYNPNIIFCNNGEQEFVWGIPYYDIRLFNFNGITISDENCYFYVNSVSPSVSLSPYKVYEFIKQFLDEITFEQISNDYIEYSKKIIQPSEIISSKIPNNIEKAYGIHLRKTDKCFDISYLTDTTENSINDLEIITKKLLEDVEDIIISEEEPTFLIVSEDNNWKLEIINIVKNISKNTGKPINILDIEYGNNPDYINHDSVLDMFCLSKCKEILQGVKYSTFSILASLLGNNKIRNYAKYLDSNGSYACNLIYCWSSIIKINNDKYIDVAYHKNATRYIANIETNINKIFI